MLHGNIYFNGKLVKEFKAEFPSENGLKRNKFLGGGVLVLAQQQVHNNLHLRSLGYALS